MMSTTETEHICGLRREDFQTTINGKKTDLYFLKNNRGNVVAITNYGGALVAIMVPDRNGVKAMSYKDMTIYKMSSTARNPIFRPSLAATVIEFVKANSSCMAKSINYP